MRGIKSVIGLPSKVGLAGLPPLRSGHAKMAHKCSRFGGKSFPNESAPQGRVALPEFKRCPARCGTLALPFEEPASFPTTFNK